MSPIAISALWWKNGHQKLSIWWEAYNPHIFSRQLGCPQGQVCGFCSGSDLKPYQPDCCCTESFHSW
ncbi:hypothetical protein PRUPE_7G060400 [Prunus persica]|uniref:Uncharacterized protein n=1 Tax=Prunus persica TaxID=3760 RepID=A0A251N9I9_PRUPE|nr:hypothetical protein PRUPE_7G060400 [Prunus persica]